LAVQIDWIRIDGFGALLAFTSGRLSLGMTWSPDPTAQVVFVLSGITISTDRRLLIKAFPNDFPRYHKQVSQIVPAFTSLDT